MGSGEPLPGDDCPKPYFLIGDDAFSLRTLLMKPFSPPLPPRREFQLLTFMFMLGCREYPWNHGQ